MIRNAGSQVIGAQLVSATDGSAFTGAVTCYVTVDGGTQAVGSVGSGACAHEGNGFHSYAPSAGETDGAHVAFTFVGSGAVPATVQVYPSSPQTGDAFARLGAPAGASVSADIAALPTDADVNVQVDAALADYDAPTKAELDAAVAPLATAAALATVDENVDAILVDTAEIGTAGAGLTEAGGTGDHLTALATAAALQTVDDEVGAIDTVVDTILVDTAALDSRLTSTRAGYLDNLATAPATQAQVASELADALTSDVIADSVPADGSRPTVAQALYMLVQFMTERAVSGTTVTVRKPDGATSLFTMTLDDDANPTSVTRAS